MPNRSKPPASFKKPDPHVAARNQAARDFVMSNLLGDEGIDPALLATAKPLTDVITLSGGNLMVYVTFTVTKDQMEKNLEKKDIS